MRDLRNLPGDAPDAAGPLLAAIDDPRLPPGHRAEIAQRLLNLDPALREQAAIILKGILADANANAAARCTAASTLLSFGGAQVSHALGALYALIDDPYTESDSRQWAAQAAAQHDPHGTPRYRSTMRAIVDDPYADVYERCEAVEAVARLDPVPGGEPVDISDLASQQPVSNRVRFRLAQMLLHLAPAHRTTVGHLLEQDVLDIEALNYTRERAGSALARLDDVARVTLARLDTEIAAFPVSLTAVAAIRGLLALDPDRQDQAACQLWRIAGDPAASPSSRAAALDALLSTNRDHRGTVIQALRTASAAQPAHDVCARVHDDDRIAALAALLRHVPAHRADAAAKLQTILAEPASPGADRRRAAQALVDGGSIDRASVADARYSDMVSPACMPTRRLQAAQGLRGLAPHRGHQVADGLQDLLVAGTTRHRAQAATVILRAQPDNAAALAVLVDIIADPHTTRPVRRDAAQALTEGDQVHCDVAARCLLPLLVDPAQPASTTIWAAERLATASPRHRDEAVLALRALLDDATLTAARRLAIAKALHPVGGPARQLGHLQFYAILTDPHAPAHVRRASAEFLVTVPGPYSATADSALLTMATDATLSLTDRMSACAAAITTNAATADLAADVLHNLIQAPVCPQHVQLLGAAALIEHHTPTSCEAADATLRKLIDRPDTHLYIACRAVAMLAGSDHRYAEPHTKRLWQILTTQTQNLDHRRWAAEALADISDALRQPVRDTLRVLVDACPDDRGRRRLARTVDYVDTGDHTWS
jgi:hypothetical protein